MRTSQNRRLFEQPLLQSCAWQRWRLHPERAGRAPLHSLPCSRLVSNDMRLLNYPFSDALGVPFHVVSEDKFYTHTVRWDLQDAALVPLHTEVQREQKYQ